jgi:hypothetical protein
MAKCNKIYRGGVHEVTPETRERVYTGAAGSLLPGHLVTISPATGFALGKGVGFFGYIVGEPLNGTVDDNLVTAPTSAVRAYVPHSGDLLVGRATAAAGGALIDDVPLTNDGVTGRLKLATPGTDEIFAYIDDPLGEIGAGAIAADTLIPIKIK